VILQKPGKDLIAIDINYEFKQCRTVVESSTARYVKWIHLWERISFNLSSEGTMCSIWE